VVLVRALLLLTLVVFLRPERADGVVSLLRMSASHPAHGGGRVNRDQLPAERPVLGDFRHARRHHERVLERRKYMWAAAPMFLIWANLTSVLLHVCRMCYFGAFPAAKLLFPRVRKQPVPGERELWLVTRRPCLVGSHAAPTLDFLSADRDYL